MNLSARIKAYFSSSSVEEDIGDSIPSVEQVQARVAVIEATQADNQEKLKTLCQVEGLIWTEK